MGLIDKLLDKLIGGHRQRFPKPVIAPTGYDPTQDPDGSIYARLVGQQMPGGGGGGGGIGVLGTLWDQVIRPLWWVWLIVGAMAIWGWWWWVGKPAKAEAQTAAAATVIAASWTATPPPTGTEAPIPTPTSTAPAVPMATAIPTLDRPTMTPTPTIVLPTMTWTPTPTETPPPTETPTPTSTAPAVPTPPPAWGGSGPEVTPTSANFARLVSESGLLGESLAVVGRVANGSMVRLKWEGGQILGQGPAARDGSFAISFVLPETTRGYHVLYVVWSIGDKGEDFIPLTVSVGVPTLTPTPLPTWTPIPTPTGTPTPILPTPTPTITPMPYPTPIGGWPFRFFFPLIFKGDLMTFISPLNGG